MATKNTVLMEHPNLKAPKYQPVRVSRRAFERVWSKKGWREVKPATATTTRSTTKKGTKR